MTDIFVFGSNLSGIHGAGAAAYALKHHGAYYGIGYGLMGTSYALPTKDFGIRTLSLDQIAGHVEVFLCFASIRRDLIFMVTPVGTGLAGYTREQIAPLFQDIPANVYFEDENGNDWYKRAIT